MLQAVVPLTPMCHLQLRWHKPSARSFENNLVIWRVIFHLDGLIEQGHGTQTIASVQLWGQETQRYCTQSLEPRNCFLLLSISPRLLPQSPESSFCTGEHSRALEGEIPGQVSSQNKNTPTLPMITDPIVLVAKVPLATHTDIWRPQCISHITTGKGSLGDYLWKWVLLYSLEKVIS